MDNQGFIRAIEKSFSEFIRSGTSRSTAKLVPLHGAIAQDMHERFGEGYIIQSQGYKIGKEGTIQGRYMSKKVDITISHEGAAVCGIAVKFVMQNYSQNSNNYFENMLGETANIRAARCPYFQMLIIPDKMPYYNKDKEITRWETFTDINIHKYCVLDTDETDVYYHTPNKTLIYVIHLPEIREVSNSVEYRREYENVISRHNGNGFLQTQTPARFSNSVILNDYETFAGKIYHAVLAQ